MVGGDDEVESAGVRGRHQFAGIALAVGVNRVQVQVPAIPARTTDRAGVKRDAAPSATAARCRGAGGPRSNVTRTCHAIPHGLSTTGPRATAHTPGSMGPAR